MPRRISVPLAAAGFLAAAAAFFLLPRFVKAEIERRLERAVPGSEARIGSWALDGRALVVEELEIRSAGFDARVKKVRAGFDRTLEIAEPEITVREVPGGTDGGASPFRAVRVRGLRLDWRAAGITAEARGDVDYDAVRGFPGRVELTIPLSKRGGLEVHGAEIRTGADGTGTLRIERMELRKMRITDIRARTAFEPGGLRLETLLGTVSRGTLSGGMRARWAPATRYEADLQVRNLDLSVLTDDLKLGAKVGLAGEIEGRLRMEGDAGGIRHFTGDLRGTEKGGDIVIRDRATLEALARNVNQPIELVESAFKEYHFDTAAAALGIEGEALTLDVSLDGAKGKRELEIALHDFI